MFFQGMIYILILVGFSYLAWRLIIKPILESIGVEVDEEEVITTTHTDRLEKTKREHEEALLSVNAVNEEKHLKGELKDINEKIKDADRQIEDTEDGRIPMPHENENEIIMVNLIHQPKEN